MIVLISDLDGTLTNNKHRNHLKTDLQKYFSVIGRDRKNKIGVDLYKSIKADFRIIISSRPSYWPPDKNKDYILLSGQEINKIWYITSHWLNYYQIKFNELLLVNPNISSREEEKVNHLIKIINIRKNDKIIYLEDNEKIANKIKKLFPFIDVNLISYNGARRLNE